MCKVDFSASAWTNGRPGVRFKTFSDGEKQIRLVEFSTSEGDPHWCEVGHAGYVLAGGLKIDVDGQVTELGVGDGISLPSGPLHRHRGLSIIPGTILFMVEDAEG